jgi:two-component system sensor histidine kinase UhpB
MKQVVTTKSQLEIALATAQKQVKRLQRLADTQRVAEEKYHTLLRAVEQSPIAIMVIDINKTFEYVNPKFTEITGFSFDEVVGKKTSIIEMERTLIKGYEHLWTVIKTGKEWRGELSYKNKKDELYWALISVYPVTTERGMMTHFIAIMEDITEQKKSEASLLQSEKKYHTLLSEMFIGFALHQCVLDDQGVMVDYVTLEVNKSYESMLHVDSKDVLGKRASALLPKSEMDEWLKLFNEVISTGKPVRYERYSSFNRKYFSGTAYCSEQGKFAVTFLDITERKKTYEALEASENKYRQLVNNLGEGIWAYDKDGRTTFVNPRMAEMTGYSIEEMIGKVVTDFISKPEGMKFVKWALDRRKRGIKERLEYEFIRKDGIPIVVAVESYPIFNDDGSYTGALAAVSDITKHKRAEKALKASMEQFQMLSTRLGQIQEEERRSISREVHDELGQLLTAMKMDLMTIKKIYPADAQTFESKLQSLLELTDSAIKRIQDISTRLRPGMLDDLGLFAAIEWQMEEFEKRTGLTCVLKLPQHEFNINAECSTVLFRILQETLTNVARHAQAHKTEVSLSETASELLMYVVDDGIGISEIALHNPKSIGLLGIRERLRPFNGYCIIQSRSIGGTEVQIHIPKHEEEGKHDSNLDC